MKRLRQLARGDGEAALDVVEIQAVGFALFFHFVDEFLPHLGFRDRLRGGDNEIALASGGHESGLIAAVAIGLAKIFYGHARHQKVLEHPVFDDFNPLRGRALIVEVVGAGEFHARQFVDGGIVDHA